MGSTGRRNGRSPDGHGGFQRSFDAPAMAFFNGKLYLAWTGTVGSGSNINVASSIDGHNFTNVIPSIQHNTSAHGISMYANNGRLYLAYVPADGFNSTIVISSTDGVNWSPPTSFGFPNTESPYTPTLAIYGATTWVTYTKPATASDMFRRLQLGFLSTGSGSPANPPNPSNGVASGAGGAWDGGSLMYYAYQGPGNSSAIELTTYQLQSPPAAGWSVISTTPTGQTAVGNPQLDRPVSPPPDSRRGHSGCQLASCDVIS